MFFMLLINNVIFKSYDNVYFVSANGDVFSTKSNKILVHNIDLDGYHRVDIQGKHVKIHKLVYQVWVGPIPHGGQINHIDDNKDNNHYLNLYVGTQKQNIQDCIKNCHRIGNAHKLIVFDKKENKTLEFFPANNFIEYSGHTCANGSFKRIFSRKWFKKRYEILSFEGNQSL